MKRPIIAREGWLIIAFFGILTIAAGVVHWSIALLGGLLLALSIWFFRDPDRSFGQDDSPAGSLVVAPADGRVMFVKTAEEPRFVQNKAIMISIFLSVFDVHINRSPVSGTVAYKEYVPGRFFAAWDERVGEMNERSYVGIQSGRFRILVSQVAGMIARRIITWPSVGQSLTTGERYGLIRFGSCTQVWLPVDSQIFVKPGDRVKGGESLIGRLPE